VTHVTRYGVGFDPDRDNYYVVVDGTRVVQPFPTCAAALAFCEADRAEREQGLAEPPS
jgi:hypothetical protein